MNRWLRRARTRRALVAAGVRFLEAYLSGMPTQQASKPRQEPTHRKKIDDALRRPLGNPLSRFEDTLARQTSRPPSRLGRSMDRANVHAAIGFVLGFLVCFTLAWALPVFTGSSWPFP